MKVSNTNPAIQLRLHPTGFPKTNSVWVEIIFWVCCDSSNSDSVTQIALAKQHDEISSGFFSLSAFCRWIRITSGAASDLDCTRLTSAKFPKLSLMNQVVLWILSHQRPAAVLIRQHQRAAVPMHTRNTHDQSYNWWLLCLCVWCALTDQGCLFRWCDFIYLFFYLISCLWKIEPVRGQIMTSCPITESENSRRRNLPEEEKEKGNT